MIILVDDEARENEGDLLLAANFVTPAAVNFMAAHARGLVCLTLTADHCQRLQLAMMKDENKSAYGTNFTVSIEAAIGVSTGISAHDRAKTIAAAAKPDAVAPTWYPPGMFFRCAPRRAVFWCAPDTPKPVAIWPTWRVFSRPPLFARL